jgi:hypothetical protein
MNDDTIQAHLAARFRDDAQALRARATVLDAQGPARRGGGGPDAAACRAMADACDRVRALFEGAADEIALTDVGRELDRLLAAERSPDVKHVYSGALAGLRQALDGDDDDADDDDGED